MFRVPECIPLFPLPNLVFFPKTYLPLHVFEPRYQEMVADAVLHGHCIGMTLLKEGWEENYRGSPPIFSMGCVGRLVSIQEFPDGRSNILLQGVERYEICQELGGKSYRRAHIALRPQPPGPELDRTIRADLVRVLEEFLNHPDEGHVWQGFFPLEGSDEILINTLSANLDFTPLERQFLLEAESIYQQARRLSDLLQFKRHEREGTRGWG